MAIPKSVSNKLLLRVIWGLSALLGTWTISRIVSLQSEASTSILFGLSFSRLIVVFIVLGMAVFFLWLAIKPDVKLISSHRARQVYARNRHTLINLLLIGCILFGWLGFSGNHNFEKLQEFYIRLQPVIQYLALIQFVHYLYLVIANIREQGGVALNFKELMRYLWPGAIIFGGLLLVWALIKFSGIGITPGYPYWGEAGTLFFGYQFVIAGVISGTALILLRRFVDKKPRGFDIGVFVLLWVIAGILWNTAELEHNFFAPRAFYQPYFPYSDAAIYDTWAYSILIGEGFTFPGFNSRPLYVSFLTLLHLVTGGNYDLLVALQVFVYALVVPGLYLLGREFYSRSLGLMIAIIGIFSQLNSIAANEFVRVSNVKLLLTEIPTGVILVYVAYFFVIGVKRAESNNKQLITSFGLLGITLLLRMHVAMVFVGLFFVLFFLYPMLKVQFRNGILLSVMVFLIVFPWMLRNYYARGVFSLDPGRFNILIEERWNPDQDEGDRRGLPPNSLGKNQKLIKPTGGPNTPEVVIPTDGVKEILAHFVHNEVLSVMSLPHTVQFHTGRNYYQQMYFLNSDWNGELPGTTPVFVTINLLLLSLGIWAAYKRLGLLGFVPLVIQLSYNFSNALVRTSGWRYLTPTEWVLVLYFSLGLIQVYVLIQSLVISRNLKLTGESPGMGEELSLTAPSVFRVGIIFILLTALISFSPLLVPKRFPPPDRLDMEPTLARIVEYTSFSLNDLETFMNSDSAVLYTGKVLYPRFYYPNEGIFHYRSEIVDYSRLEFTLLNWNVWASRIAVAYPDATLNHGEDVVLLGCRTEENRIEAAIVLGLDDKSPFWIQRNGLINLSCPLNTPNQ